MVWLISDVPREITFEDLVLRPLQVDDAGRVVDAVAESLPELLQWMPWAKFEPQSVTQREALILQWKKDWEGKKDFPFGVFRSNQLVGSCGLHLRHDEGQLEIGYWVRTSCVGQGIATRTSQALTDVAFALPEVQEVLITHDIANVRSQSIPKKLGFTFVKQYDTEINANSATGHNRLWSMKREAWRAD
jgi:RimJ/RimL family protein N-acetyltransferase